MIMRNDFVSKYVNVPTNNIGRWTIFPGTAEQVLWYTGQELENEEIPKGDDDDDDDDDKAFGLLTKQISKELNRIIWRSNARGSLICSAAIIGAMPLERSCWRSNKANTYKRTQASRNMELHVHCII
jgi:hypothetical protein